MSETWIHMFAFVLGASCLKIAWSFEHDEFSATGVFGVVVWLALSAYLLAVAVQ